MPHSMHIHTIFRIYIYYIREGSYSCILFYNNIFFYTRFFYYEMNTYMRINILVRCTLRVNFPSSKYFHLYVFLSDFMTSISLHFTS